MLIRVNVMATAWTLRAIGASHRHSGKRLVKLMRTLLLAVLKLTGAASTLIAASLISRWFGGDALGAFGVLMTLIAIGALVSSFGTPVFLMTHDAPGIGEADARLLSLGAILTASCAIVPVLAFQAPNREWASFIVGAVAAWALVLATGAILISDSRFISNSLISDLIRPSIPLLALLATWIASRGIDPSQTTFAAFGAMLFFFLALGCAFYIWPKKSQTTLARNPETRKSARHLLKVGLSALPLAIVALLGAQADRLYLSRMVPLDELGVYVAGQSLVGFVTHFLTAILVQKTPALVGHLSKGDFQRITQISRVVSRASVLVALLALLSVFLMTPLLGAFFQLPGDEIAIVGGILLAGTGASMVFGTGASLMTYEGNQGRIRLLLYLSASLLVSILVGVTLVSVMGIYGAALGTALGTVMQRLLPFLHYRSRGVSLLAIGGGTRSIPSGS